MAELDQLVVPDWMKDTPAPAPPKHHVEKASQAKVEHREEPNETKPNAEESEGQESNEEETSEEQSSEEESSDEASEDEEDLPKVQVAADDDSKVQKDAAAKGNSRTRELEEADSLERAQQEEAEAEFQDVIVPLNRPKIYQVAPPLKADIPTHSENNDQSAAFEVVKARKWKSKPKDPNAPVPSKKERDDIGERVLVIKGRPPVIKGIPETTPAVASKSTVESEATGDPGKSEMPLPLPPPITNLPKPKASKKATKLERTEPTEDYVRPTSKVANKFSKPAAVKDKTNLETTTPSNAAATLEKLKSEQEALIRKKRTKAAAVSAPLKRALKQKRRHERAEQLRHAAEKRAVYELANPQPAAPVGDEPAAPAPEPPTTTHTRLQKAFEAAKKGEVRPAIDMVATPKVRQYLPKNAQEDSALRWKLTKWAFWAFVALIFYVLHLA